MPRQTLDRRLVAMTLALAALMTTAMSCGHPTKVTRGAGQATPGHPPPVIRGWQVASPLPQQDGAPVVFTAAPSDGRIVYACGYAPPGRQPLTRLWSSADSGVSWRKPVSILVSRMTSSCQVTVDAHDPQRALAAFDTVYPDASPAATSFVTLLTTDGGGAWSPQPIAGPRLIASLTSYGGALHAAGNGLDMNGHTVTGVWTSDDRGATWSVPAPNPLGAAPQIWVNEQTGAMIGENTSGPLPALWRAEVAGQTWAPITVPLLASATGWQSLVVAESGAGWRLCVAAVIAPGPTEQNALACSSDGGGSWGAAPADNPSAAGPDGEPYIWVVTIFAVASDGALLGAYGAGPTGVRLTRLAPGASQWTAMAQPPDANDMATLPTYSSGPGGGRIAAFTRDSRAPMATLTYG